MAPEPVMQTTERQRRASDRDAGFVLVTVLVLLALLTMLSVGMYLASIAAQEDSAAAARSAQAKYYAETAISWLRWAWANDADLDAGIAPTDMVNRGDREEWLLSTKDPGPTSATGTGGKVMYFDNTPLNARPVRWPKPPAGIVLHRISVNLPRYVRLDVAADGTITTAVPDLPHGDPPRIGTDVPVNGAVLWVTAGNETQDYELDPTGAACGGAWIAVGKGCDKATGAIVQYDVVIYAVGYVDGKPLSLIRALMPFEH